jgi:Flp pilus assembly protein TadD
MTESSHRVCRGALEALVAAGCLIAAIGGGCSRQLREAGRSVSQDQGEAVQMHQDRPPTEKTLVSLAEILAAQGKDPQCEFVLHRCIQQYPQFMPARNSLAELLMRQGRVHEAVAVLSAALEMCPRDPVLLNNLGMCLMVRREYEEALRQFTRAAGLRPECKRYRANMAAALALLGRYDESSALLRQVLPEPYAEHNAQVLRRAGERHSRSAISVRER